MAKTEATLQLERDIWSATHKQGVFGCYEVTIGWFGNERVDYITYDTKGIWRCYEIKVSKSDFHSKAHNTFLGHYNYYVMPRELYKQVKDEIPTHIGVYCGSWCEKKAKKQELKKDEQVLKNSLIRSLYREVEKQIKNDDQLLIQQITRSMNYYKHKYEKMNQEYYNLLREIQNKYGSRWNKNA